LTGVRIAYAVVRAWLGLVAFDLAIAAGFKHVHGRLARLSPSIRRSRLSIEDVVWAVDEGCVWYVKRAACFQRSAVATRLLRRYGWPAQLVIGFRPIPFESHAWVEVDGTVVNDRQAYRRRFTVLERL